MTIKALLLFSTTLLISCSQTENISEIEANASGLIVEESSFSCPHQEQRKIHFSSDQTTDTLDIQIIGENCDLAVINLRIITTSGDLIHNTTARALSYTYDDEGPEGVERMLESLITTDSYVSNLPENFEDLTEANAYYYVNMRAAKDAQANKLPFFCHKAGKSFSKCFVFWNGKSTYVFSSGS